MANFVKVKCKCGNEQNIFDRLAMQVKCNSCNELLAETSGGKAIIIGELISKLE